MRRSYYQSWRYRYVKHRQHAVVRDIPFRLTFNEWCAIWHNSGRWHQCGHSAGQYVMARYGDRGAYELGNVRICPVEENHAEWREAHPELLRTRLGKKIPFVMTDARKARYAQRNGKPLPDSTKAAMKAAHAKRLAAITPEQWDVIGQNISAGLKKNWTPRMSEQRSENINKQWAALTPEQRSERLKKAWITRKQRGEGQSQRASQ